MDKISLKAVNKNEWLFEESASLQNNYEQLHLAEDYLGEAKFEKAKNLLDKIIKDVPECIEAYNDTYLYYLYTEREQEAFYFLKNSVEGILAALPTSFLNSTESKLHWPFLENRPFLRIYFNLAEEYLSRNKFRLAQSMFENILQWNPNDNQGARERILICYFELGELNKIKKLCDQYSDDCLPGILYAKPLALFAKNKKNLAQKALKQAMQILPNIAKELIKKRHTKPTSQFNGLIAFGSKEEAYQYWLEFGKYWKHTEGALELVNQTLNQDKVRY